ncbi:hypothetical protein C8J57DRAFT_1251820 [Mycena rebaudengoi]|nr:hypothetical protein C8J57DRAFT_1251820 [Mycena rebaudengoi]
MSDAGAALRKRLGELASSIALQKVLYDLERSRAATRHQLNTIFDPIARLPLELSSDIFMRCLPEIALSTPALWVTIHVDFPRAEGLDQLFNSYLTRSRSRMLSVTFSGKPDKNISRALCQHADRVHKLELLEFPTHRDDLLPLASFSGLKALTLAIQDDSGGDGSTIRIASLLAMLRDAPGIVECTLDNIYMDDDDTLNHHQKEPLILQVPSLQYLALGTDPSGSSNSYSASMLEYLSLPALRTLVISHLDIDITHLISFFTRSEAPLRSLSINSCYPPWNPHAAAQLFGLMPTLADLRLITLAIGDPTVFLELLSCSPQRFILPQLRVLELRPQSLVRSEFDLLCTTLSARCTQIKTFRYILPHCNSSPDADVLDNLRALAAEYGTEIYIGHGDGPNYSVGVCLRSNAYNYLLNTTLALARTSGPLYRDDLLPLSSFSGLKALTLAIQDGDDGRIGIASLLAMLRNAPGIVECTLENIYMDDDDPLNHHQKDPLILPSLQHLALGSRSSIFCGAFMLEYLSLPALRTLIISDLDIDITPWDPREAAQLFGLMPTLADLSVIAFAISDVTTVLELLSYSPQRFLLPQLRVLELKLSCLIRSDVDLLGCFRYRNLGRNSGRNLVPNLF